MQKHCFAIVAIPAHDEADRIGRCLAALATQRGSDGAPLRAGAYEILVFANNCRDATIEVATALAAESPQTIRIVAESLPPSCSNAGWARKRAMDLAADRLTEMGRPDGVILTTDADTVPGPTWVDATLRSIREGADGVAGYVDADPAEMMRLGRRFVERGRLEERYMATTAAIYALFDPRPHDPWPCHRVSAGASLAVTLAAYQAIGGLPAMAVGEDAALTLALDDAGFRVRHAMDVCVSTSLRFDGRAAQGAADTIRHRHANEDAPCDDDVEPAFDLIRRARHKGRLRAMSEKQDLRAGLWASALKLSVPDAKALVLSAGPIGFESFWLAVSAASPVLRNRRGLRPSDLPREIRRADRALRLLRRASLKTATNDADDKFRRPLWSGPAGA